MIRVIVVDDEASAREGLLHLLDSDPQIEVVQCCDTAPRAADAIRDLHPDLVLLDVRMPGVSGLDLVREIGTGEMPLFILVTAFDTHALDAFDLHAVDYLLKPFDDERFFAAIDRAKATLRDRTAGRLVRRLADAFGDITPALAQSTEGGPAPTAEPRPLEHLVIKNKGRITLLRIEDIDWIEAVDYYARVHATEETYLIRETMKSLDARLSSSRFFRLHRSALVNLDRIREIQPMFRGEHVVILRNGTRIPLNRSRRRALESRLRQNL